MSENVVKFYPANAAENPDAVLEQAIGQYEHVLILGWDADGEFDGRASLGLSEQAEVLWLIEWFKMKLLRGDFSE
jgi:hypothetical protein